MVFKDDRGSAPAADWISDGEKYALFAMQVELEKEIPLKKLSENHWIASGAGFAIPKEWIEWLGTIRADELEASNLLLISKLPSKSPGVLDAENQNLQRHVHQFYCGLLLSSVFAAAHRPVMLTGSRRNGRVDIRSLADYDAIIPHPIQHYPIVLVSELESAVRLARGIEAARIETRVRTNWRFFRTLSLYTEARTISDNLDRLHQYCRCIEGLILPDPGETKRQFKSRTELFIGPSHHDLMGEMYDLRSTVEHLNEHRYLEVFDRNARLKIFKCVVIAEFIARKALAHIASDASVLDHFANFETLTAFWGLPSEQRRNIWGSAIDINQSLLGYDPQIISDAELGGAEN